MVYARPLRIVQLVESLEVGGLEAMALNLAIAHQKAGHFSSIYTVFGPGFLAAEARAAGVPVVSFHKKNGFSGKAVLGLAKRLLADRAHVVHTHNSSIHHYGALAGNLAGAAVVNTRHGLALHSSKRQEKYFKFVLPLTRAVVFVCDYGLRFFKPKVSIPESKCNVILNGIPIQKFQSFRAAPGSRKPLLRFGTVGRLVKAKAHGDLLEAFAIVAQQLPGAELNIWGAGALQSELEQRRSALGLLDRVHFQGQISNPEEAFRNLDAFVLSSISEGLPLVVLEAMAAGLPIVSTRVGGVPEVAPEGAAWFAEPANPLSLAQAMLKAAASDLMAAGDIAYQAAKRFTVEKMQQSYEGLFLRVLGQAGGVRRAAL